MKVPFITICFVEFFIYSIMCVVATCKYLPIFTSQSIAILLVFMLGYLVQASLYLKIRKSVGPRPINMQLT